MPPSDSSAPSVPVSSRWTGTRSRQPVEGQAAGLSFLIELTEAVAQSAPTGDVARTAASGLAALLGTELVLVTTERSSGRIAEVLAAAGTAGWMPDGAALVVEPDSALDLAFKHEASFVVSAGPIIPEARLERPALADRLRVAAVAPIRGAEVFHGAIVVYSAHHRAVQGDSVRLVQAAAQQVALALDARLARMGQQRSSRIFQETFDAISSHIALLDREGRIVQTNAAWRRFALDNGGDLASCDVGADYLAPTDADPKARRISRGIRQVLSGARKRFEAEYPCHSSEANRWFRLVVNSFEFEGERMAVVKHENITDVVEKTLELEAVASREHEARATAEEANRVKSDFMAVVSHELRTPLTAIVGYAELLEIGVGGTLSGEGREFIRGINESTHHLRDLIEEILTFSRLEAGREEVALEDVDFQEVIRSVATVIQPLANQKALRTDWVSGPKAIHGRSDPRKVRQILLNLASNAVKFTEGGKVSLHVKERRDWITFEVADTGSGIDPESMQRIFEPFWQAQFGRGGTGLGLAISRHLARLLGGDLTARSTVGEGSVFTLVLPRRSVAPTIPS